MEIEFLRSLLLKHGLSQDDFNELEGLARALPDTKVAGAAPGLSERETSVLLSHVLRQAASALDISFEHPDVIRQVGFDVVEPRRMAPEDSSSNMVQAAAPAASDSWVEEDRFDSAV